jgi:hypothetical protein
MSWVKAISDSIEAKAPPKETLRLIQGGISSVTVQLQRAIDAVDPADYPLLLAVLDLSSASLRQTLPHAAQFLAELIKSMTSSVAVTVPETFRTEKEENW